MWVWVSLGKQNRTQKGRQGGAPCGQGCGRWLWLWMVGAARSQPLLLGPGPLTISAGLCTLLRLLSALFLSGQSPLDYVGEELATKSFVCLMGSCPLAGGGLRAGLSGSTFMNEGVRPAARESSRVCVGHHQWVLLTLAGSPGQVAPSGLGLADRRHLTVHSLPCPWHRGPCGFVSRRLVEPLGLRTLLNPGAAADVSQNQTCVCLGEARGSAHSY